MQRNPKQMLAKMQQMMDPRMLQQMGGAQNMMKIMKEVSTCFAYTRQASTRPPTHGSQRIRVCVRVLVVVASSVQMGKMENMGGMQVGR